VLATVCALAAVALAGGASVAVQVGGPAGYAVFAVLVVLTLALIGASGYWFRRSRPS
jgi:hypothetical protein